MLHGESGIPDNQLLSAFSKGINKFNLGTEFLGRYYEAAATFSAENADNPDPVKIINLPEFVQSKLQPYLEERPKTLCRFNKIFMAEKKVADFVLQNPQKTVDSNVSELADYVLLSSGKEEAFNCYKDYAQTNLMATVDALLNFVTNEEWIKTKQADKPEMILSEYKL